MRYWEIDQDNIYRRMNELEKRLSLALRLFSEPLEEIIMPPLTAPDPKEREIAAASRAIDQAKRRKAHAKLKDLQGKLASARAAAMGTTLPQPPMMPVKPKKP